MEEEETGEAGELEKTEEGTRVAETFFSEASGAVLEGWRT